MKTSEKSNFLFFIVMTGIAISLATIFSLFPPWNYDSKIFILQLVAIGFGLLTTKYADGISQRLFFGLMIVIVIYSLIVSAFATQGYYVFLAGTVSFCIVLIVFLNIYLFYRKTKSNQNYASIKYNRKGEGIDNYIDMVGEKCKLLAIEKYIRSPFYCVYFKCKGEGGTMLVLVDIKSMSENEKLLLKSIEFELAIENDHVVVKSSEYAKRATRTAVPVQYIDDMRGYVGKRIYEKL